MTPGESRDQQVQEGKRRVPLRDLHATWRDDVNVPVTWRLTFFFIGGAVLEAAKALHRIADAMEQRPVADQLRKEDTRRG